MIGPGWLPRYRPRAKRTLAYTRRRRSKRRVEKQARSTQHVNTEIVLFDHGPTEFPVATVRPREARAQVIALVGALQAWLVARWQWFKPRSVPCAVAGLGMIAVLAFSQYLVTYKGQCSKGSRTQAVHIDIAPR